MTEALAWLRAAWATFDWRIAALLFLTYAVIDSLNAAWALSVTKLKPFRAATNSVLVYFLIGLGVINYTRNFLYILPMAFGAGTGTFLLVRHERLKLPHRRRH